MNAVFQLQEGGPSHFSQYGKAFQEKIFQGLITDQDWAKQMAEVMKPHFFDLKYIQYLTDRYFAYFEKYRCFPTMQLLITIIREELTGLGADGLLREQIVEFLQRVRANPHPGDLQYVKDRTLDFCKRQAFKEALEQAVDLVSDDKFESVVPEFPYITNVFRSSVSGNEIKYLVKKDPPDPECQAWTDAWNSLPVEKRQV